jgi:hypothetical protein
MVCLTPLSTIFNPWYGHQNHEFPIIQRPKINYVFIPFRRISYFYNDSSNPVHGEVYSMQLFVIMFVTFNNISFIFWCSVLIGGGRQSIRRKPVTFQNSLTNIITNSCIEYTSPWTGFDKWNIVESGVKQTISLLMMA